MLKNSFQFSKQTITESIMKNNGLVSVGHLITVKCDDQVKDTFEAFNSLLSSFMSEKFIQKNCARHMFDEFFRTLASSKIRSK